MKIFSMIQDEKFDCQGIVLAELKQNKISIIDYQFYVTQLNKRDYKLTARIFNLNMTRFLESNDKEGNSYKIRNCLYKINWKKDIQAQLEVANEKKLINNKKLLEFEKKLVEAEKVKELKTLALEVYCITTIKIEVGAAYRQIKEYLKNEQHISN